MPDEEEVKVTVKKCVMCMEEFTKKMREPPSKFRKRETCGKECNDRRQSVRRKGKKSGGRFG